MNTGELFGNPQRLLMDPVHGGIRLFDHELAVIDRPLFQRLRHIYQTDILFMVFPGSRHSRFEHSIGAMHIAGRFFQSVTQAYLADLSHHHRDLSSCVTEAINYFYKVVRLSALLHDVGHAPFSHQFEVPDSIRRMLSFERLWQGNDWRPYYNVTPTKFSHEHFSVRYALTLLGEVTCLPVEVHDVLVIMETAEGGPSPEFKKHVNTLSSFIVPHFPTTEETCDIFLSFLRKMISSELDVDKMDYLLRDSYFSGSRYGSYNLDHLLTTLRLGYDSKERWTGIGITEKGIQPLEDFVHSRFQMYVSVYYHKTVTGLRWLLEQAITEVAADPPTAERIANALYDPDQFVHLTDAYLWEAFRNFAAEQKGSACDRLINRIKLRYLFTVTDTKDFEMSDILFQRSLAPDAVVMRSSEAKFSQLHTAVDQIRVITRDKSSGRGGLRSVRSGTDFFGKFENKRITQVFERPDLRARPLGQSN